MNEVLTEDSFSLEDQQSMTIALAMLRRRLLDFDLSEIQLSKLMTVSSELAFNVIKYATRGRLILQQVRKGRKQGLQISVTDDGPGIPDIEQALQDHFSTQGTLGLGLPGVRRLVDDFKLESEVGRGTKVFATLWL